MDVRVAAEAILLALLLGAWLVAGPRRVIGLREDRRDAVVTVPGIAAVVVLIAIVVR